MEILYHYLWKHKMMGRPLTTVDGLPLKIEWPGVHNDDAGPDFSGARISINGQKWAGNVEIHIKASDWYAHAHHKDPAYDSVILHVVAVSDTIVRRSDGSIIPQTAVVLPRDFYATYARLCADLKGSRCNGLTDRIPELVVTDWLESLSIERLHFKANRLLEYYSQLGCDWEQAVFTAVARALGFGLNGLPFEMLAKNLPLKYIYHHADDLLQTEALLLGQAGLLNPNLYPFEEYYQSLCREYMFLGRKYGLHPMRPEIWKYARTRPNNFPHRRIALLARALHDGVRFSAGLADADADIDRLLEFFNWKLDGYWIDHCGFGPQSGAVRMPASLSQTSRELLIINVAAPFYFAHSRLTGNYELAERGANMLTRLKAERNTIIQSWQACGFKADNALRSQALLHLRTEYCDRNRCLDCRFGHYLLRADAGGHRFDYRRIEENQFVTIPD